MRVLSDLFMINGTPMFAPDEDVDMSFEDLDSSDTGRDESGVMHRIVVRYKAGSYSFSYSSITEDERNYMESLFGDTPDFEFTHPDRLDSSRTVKCRAYRSKYSLSWKNARTGLWKNYKFNIIE